MKATNTTTYRSMLTVLNSTSSRLQDLQIQTATGKKLNKASDNPAGVGPALLTRSKLASADSHIETTRASLDRLKAQDTQLGQIDNLMNRAIELASAAGNGAYGDYERDVLAAEMADIRDAVKSLANGQMDGKYFFSGYQDRTAPFTDNPAYPATSSEPYLYDGDYGKVELEITPGETEVVNFTGNALFLGDADNDGATDPGNVDIFATLAAIETAMINNDSAGATAELDNLYRSQEQLSQYRSQVGVVSNRLDRASENMEDVKVDLEEILSRYEDADLLESITQMTQQEKALEAAMSVTGRIAKLSIMDYL